MALIHAMWRALARIYPHERRQAQDNIVVSGSFVIVGGITSLMLGFMVVSVWQHYTATESVVSAEANAIADLERMSRTLPPEVQRQTQDATRSYLRLVIDEEWPMQAAGGRSVRADAALSELWETYTDLENDYTGRALYDRSIDGLSELSDSRRQRLGASGQPIPILMWLLLGLGASAAPGWACTFACTNPRLQHALVISMTAIIATALFLVSALSNPFDEHMTIQPSAFETVRDSLRQLEL